MEKIILKGFNDEYELIAFASTKAKRKKIAKEVKNFFYRNVSASQYDEILLELQKNKLIDLKKR